MHQVNIHEAKTQLSRLLEEVQAGGEVIIAKAGKPIARITSYTQDVKSLRKPGGLKGKIWISPDFDKPDPELEALFYDAPLYHEAADDDESAS